MHIDMNAYFASVEQERDPTLRGCAIGVTSRRLKRGVIAAASREAKACGVKTAMPVWQARRLCPDLILVPGNHELYEKTSGRIFDIFRRYTHLVEPFSIDEAFLDVTPVADDSLDAVAIAQSMKQIIAREIGECLTSSVGIAPNKLVAKMASDLQKPDGLVVVHARDVPSFMQARNLSDICGLGPKTLAKLAGIRVTSIADLQSVPLKTLEGLFHSYGRWLFHAARGEDDSPVVSEVSAPKSFGHVHTLSENTNNPAVLRRVLFDLAEKVASRMRAHNMSALGVSVTVRYGDFQTVSRQTKSQAPIRDGLVLAQIGWMLFHHVRDPKRSVRLIGISARDVISGRAAMLFPEDRKRDRLLNVLDRISSRFGCRAWTRASLLKNSPLKSGSRWDSRRSPLAQASQAPE